VPYLELSVVVASNNRPLRLRWLLNALDRQALEGELWEVVIAHEAEDVGVTALVAGHPLTAAGRLRAVVVEGSHRTRAAKLNGALRVVQGPVQRDPAEEAMMYSPFPRTHEFRRVPRLWAEGSNIAYPRELLERVGGFAEQLECGEDTDLACRCLAAGAEIVGHGQMRTYGAIDEGSLLTRLGETRNLRGLPPLVRRQPRLRRHLPLWTFLKPSHLWLPIGLAGLRLDRHHPLGVLLTLPWLIQYPFRPGARGRIRDVIELPGHAAVDLTEIVQLALASVRHRTLLL
jgi:hypothetical protein